MRILFLTLANFRSVNEPGLYQDLIREFINKKHKVDVLCPTERRNNEKTHLLTDGDCRIVRVQVPNIQKVGSIEKVISTFSLNFLYTRAYDKYYSESDYDLLLFVTPPITLNSLIKRVKLQKGAVTYLLLKDIFPQNAIDLGYFRVNSFIHKFFRQKEKRLYLLADKIGCMSEANLEYVLKHNEEVSPTKLEVNPNVVNLDRISRKDKEVNRVEIRKKYQIPENDIVFVFGGNLGVPQGVQFIKKAMIRCLDIAGVHFVIVGNGTKHHELSSWVLDNKINKVKLMKSLPKEEYLDLLLSLDVGMIFLDYKFTIPNFPSRVLSYMEKKIPVLVCVDPITDLGEIVQQNYFGYHTKSNDLDSFVIAINYFVENKHRIGEMGLNGFNYLVENYTTIISYKKILNAFTMHRKN